MYFDLMFNKDNFVWEKILIRTSLFLFNICGGFFLFIFVAGKRVRKMQKSETDSSVTMRDMEIFNDIRNFIRRKINNCEGNYIDTCSQKAEVVELIRRSVETRESNSAIICGPPGCGKTALIENVIQELANEGVINDENSRIIRLNGLLHIDDRIALQDISRQLKVAEGSELVTFASFQDNLIHLIENLKEKKKEGSLPPCAIFILDEFHLFCGHKNQILLYNLFDIAQSGREPVCVIGLTFYTDIMDLLEKRVLSRFSHRVIWLSQNLSIEERLKLFKTIFTLKPEDLSDVDEIYKVLWNMRIDELMENPEVIEVIKKQLELNPSQRKFRNLMFKLFNTVTFEFPLLTADNVKTTFSVPDFHLNMLSNLSLLEMALIIAIKHQTTNFDREPFNFEMIYNQCLKFCNKNSTTLITERSVVLKAFQRLQELEIIVPAKKAVGNSLGKVPNEYQLYSLNLTEEQISEAVKLNAELTTELRQWAVYSA